MGHSHRQTVLLMYLWAALFSGLVVGLSVVRIPVVWFALITLAAIGALVFATAPKLRPWHATGGGKRERPRGSRPRSDDPLSATPDLAAPVGGPVQGVAPPSSLPFGNGVSPNGQSPNGQSPNGQPPNGQPPTQAGAGHGAHARRPLPYRRAGGTEPVPPAAPPPWTRRG
jgi:hypothetical protein